MAESYSTIVGVFDDYSTAESAARDLTESGVPREAIEVKSNFMTGAAGRSASTGTHEGGVSGFFQRLFGGGEHADHYSEAVRRGGAVVCVTAPPDRIDRVVEILNEKGAVDIDRRVAGYRERGYTRHDPKAPPYSHDEAVRERERYRGADENTSIPVVEEELHVGKRVVHRGGVRVYSHVVEQPVEESVTLREEHVNVERRPVDRPLASGEAAGLRDRSIEVTETVEEPVVQKRARVREEVVIDKHAAERTHQVREKVRRTEVKVERLGQGGDRDEEFRGDYESNYAQSGMPYESVRPAYEYGYNMAADPRYAGRSWSDLEGDFRTDFERQYPNSSWDRMKGAVRCGWKKATGKR